MNLLISACLLGLPCRYDGTGSPVPALMGAALGAHRLVPVCPEQLGGLPTPRPPAERVGGRVLTDKGADVTAFYTRGAAVCCDIARMFACTHAVLKSRSPSCGCGQIYDGSFRGRLAPGSGITAERLREQGVVVADETGFLQWDW